MAGTRCDLKGIKDAIKTILTTANTMGASPIDLSADLNTRVNKIMSIHPELIPIQASFYPCVTCVVTEKPTVTQDIAKNQLSGKRRADISIDVIGAIWNNKVPSPTTDLADEDIGYLMENVELILRSDHTLLGTVNWQVTTNVRYYITPMQEGAHLRAGILTLQATVFY